MTVEKDKVRAVLFDFGGTLDADGIPWKERFFPIYREAGLEWEFSEFERYFHAADDSLVEEKLDRVGFSAMLSEQVSRVLRAADAFDAGLARRIADRFQDDCRAILERNRALLERIARHYHLGIVSNFYGNLPFLCEEIGYAQLFPVVIDSVRAGISKPEAGIFLAGLRALECRPSEAVFVGDNPFRDMGGARAMGMPHVWLNALHPERPACCEGDRTIRSLPEIEDILL